MTFERSAPPGVEVHMHVRRFQRRPVLGLRYTKECLMDQVSEGYDRI